MNTTQLKRIIAHAIPCGLDRVSDTDHERLVTAILPLLPTAANGVEAWKRSFATEEKHGFPTLASGALKGLPPAPATPSTLSPSGKAELEEALKGAVNEIHSEYNEEWKQHFGVNEQSQFWPLWVKADSERSRIARILLAHLAPVFAAKDKRVEELDGDIRKLKNYGQSVEDKYEHSLAALTKDKEQAERDRDVFKRGFEASNQAILEQGKLLADARREAGEANEDAHQQRLKYDELFDEAHLIRVERDALRQEAGDLRAGSAPDGNLSSLLVMPSGLHPATRKLVKVFAAALAEKLFKAEQKYGYSDGWQTTEWIASGECAQKLRDHADKGDPRDVAAYCAFLWWHKASSATPSASTKDGAEAGDGGSPTDSQMLNWLLDYVTQKGTDGMDSIVWSLYDEDGKCLNDEKSVTEDEVDSLKFDRRALRSAMSSATARDGKGEDRL